MRSNSAYIDTQALMKTIESYYESRKEKSERAHADPQVHHLVYR